MTVDDRGPSHISEEQRVDLVDGHIAPGARRAAEEHLAECEDCRLVVERERVVVAALRSLPTLDPPRSFTLPERAVPNAWGRAAGWMRAASGLAAAFLVVLLAADLMAPSGMVEPAALEAPSAELEGLRSFEAAPPPAPMAAPAADAMAEGVPAAPEAAPEPAAPALQMRQAQAEQAPGQPQPVPPPVAQAPAGERAVGDAAPPRAPPPVEMAEPAAVGQPTGLRPWQVLFGLLALAFGAAAYVARRRGAGG